MTSGRRAGCHLSEACYSSVHRTCFGGKAVTLESQKPSADAARDDGAKRTFDFQFKKMNKLRCAQHMLWRQSRCLYIQ